MGLETGDTIASLNASWPLGSDPRSEGDDHLRLLKRVLQNDVVPAAGGAFRGAVQFPSGGSMGSPNVQLGGSAIGWHSYGSENEILAIVGGERVASFGEANRDLPEWHSVVTREKGDARYFWSGKDQFEQGNYDDTNYSAEGTKFQRGSIAIKRNGNDPSNWTCFQVSYATVSGGQKNRTMRIRSDGNVENANNSYGGLSDVRLKENIVDAGPELEDLLKLRVVHFNMIGDTLRQLGLIAQEVEQIKPGLVDEDPDTGMKSLKYSVLVPILVKAVQELTARVVALEAAG